MRSIYTFLLYLLTPFIVLRLLWKSRRLPAYRHRILERFSWGNRVKTPVDIWVHAVSLGEVIAAMPMIDALLAKKWRVLVTTMTPTGSEQVIKRFGERVAHQYIPYDLPWALRRFFNKIEARVGIIMETELWPNVIHQAKKKKLPLLLANARISDRAFPQYEKVRFLFKPVLNQFSAILAQSEQDAQRFIALGANPALVQVLGNMKFDLRIDMSIKKECARLKEKWGGLRPVVVAASTHDNEEQQLLLNLRALQAGIPDIVLLIAPRHPERFQAVYQLSQAHGFKTGLRSEPSTIDIDTEVIVADSLGELLDFYQLSDYAFVGGSLVPIGGHNVLEPIAVKVPVFCGPYLQNSKAICQDLRIARAIVVVETVDALIAGFIKMYQNESQRQEQIDRATAVLTANQGTVIRYIEKIEAFLGN